jgi:hypothetical protein
MGAMEYARRHTRAAVLGIGVAFALAGPQWIGRGDGGAAAILFVLALEAIPFLVLAAASDEMPWWLAILAAGAFGALTDAGVRDIATSTSSAAAIAIPIIPLVLLFVVPCLVTACDVVALVRLRLRGGTVAPPQRREIVLALVLGGFGFLALYWFGLLAGLATAFAVWAHRVRPHPLAGA